MDGVSSAAVEVVLQNLINVAKEEYFLIQGLEKEVEQLQTTLDIIQGYLIDAENKSITQNSVKIWLKKLEAVAFDADNVLDEFSYHLLHKKVEKMKTPKHKVLSCFSSLNSITRPRDMALQIKQINADFDSMNKRATELNLQSLVLSAPAAPLISSAETNSFTRDPIFVGRDDQVLELVEKLTHFPQEEIFSILAIVGMGGMGKTTLTRKVFNHQNIKDRFGSLFWVHVSQIFDPIILFKKILSINIGGVETEQSVLEKLKEAFKAKTYLLVLDDVWNEDLSKWEHFINSISGVTSTNGNAIIITTRSDKVASLVRPHHIHPLKGLSDEDCWSIIKAKAFENGDVTSGGFEMIGREIAKKCQHLPLAANVVGAVLRCKSKEEWHLINEKWVSDGEGGKNISKILKLSYDHLPSPSLKKCFTYCSIFPKGKEIEKQEVIEQWMAEGFLHDDERNEMESVGNKFFDVLLLNSLLLFGGENKYRDVEVYVMHDLVHDMASSVLGYRNSADGIAPVRYLTLKQEPHVPKQVAKYLRALLSEGEIHRNMLGDLKYLHVLTVGGEYRVKELPDSIRKMIHLRNLNISNTWIKKLPDWIGELYNLQTLRTENRRLRKLPSTLKYLINLRHLYIYSWVELPAEIGRLICLQTLKHFRVGDKKGYQIEELGRLKNLKGELQIHNLEKVHGKEEALKADIFQKPNLSDLHLLWNRVRREGETNDESVLEGLQPHQNLKKLQIVGFNGKRFPLWSEKMAVRDGPQGSWVPLDNLIQIELSSCKECEEIPKLEYLPNLKSLSLDGLLKLRFINTSLSNLTSLIICRLEVLECLPDWLFYNNQTLTKLMISGCPELRELPDGLDTLNFLDELTIGNCQNLRSTGNPSGGVGWSQGILLKLSIERCGGLMELPRRLLESWAPSLQTLKLKNLSSLENLPKLMDCFAKSISLTELKISGVPEWMAACTVESWDLRSLRNLKIDVSKECSMESSVAITQTVNGILQGCCKTLTRFSLKGSENWEWLPESLQHLTSVYHLKIKNSGVEELPQWFGNLSSLRELRLHSCKKLRCLPSGNALELLDGLYMLAVKDCPQLLINSEWRSIRHLTILVDGRIN